jgi:hypothetical protein
MSLKEQIESNGVVIIRGALLPSEIERLRDNVRLYFSSQWIDCDCGKVQNNAAVACKSLEWLFFHPNLISAMKEVLGDESVVFTGNCDIHQNKLGNWHKDLGFFDSCPFYGEDSRIYKVGIYLQDQSNSHRAFLFRRGSHLFSNLNEGDLDAMTSNVGDIIIFDIRLTHSGMLPSLIEKFIWRFSRFISTQKKQNPIGRMMKEMYWKIKGIQARESIFFSFGPNNAATDAFAKNIVHAQHGMEIKNARLSSTLISSLKSKDILISRWVSSQAIEKIDFAE